MSIIPVLSLRERWLGATCPRSQLTNDGGWILILIFLTPSLCFFPLLGISNGPTSGVVMTQCSRRYTVTLQIEISLERWALLVTPVHKAHDLSAPTQWHPDLRPATLGYRCPLWSALDMAQRIKITQVSQVKIPLSLQS